ncbi:MAG: pyridoxal phosphate-dependent aminotransferase [Gammaproteobacteria bacterium]|nr:pyridoxal phosphate-dependent aminotransferase [Gammaproteobacteria bacterium]
MDVDFDCRIDRRGTDSYKWDDNEKLFGRRDLLPFWVADMDFATPEPILDAIRLRCEHPVLGYGIRSDEYYSAIEDWLLKHHQWQVPREWMMFCPPSSIVGIDGVISLLTEPGESILAPMPTYGPLIGLIVDNNRRILECPLREDNDGRFHLDVADMESRIEDDTRMIVFCSPHNPTGRVFTKDELSALADLAERHNLIVVSDEVHMDLVMPGHRHTPYGSIGGHRSVTVISPNKTFNTAGIPQATLIMPDESLRARYQGFLNKTQLNHDSTFGAEAMVAGYRHCEEWLEKVVGYIADNHRFVGAYLDEQVPGVRKVTAEGTYLGWLDFRKTGLSQDEIMDRLVNIGGVGLYSGTDFGEQGRGFFRMNIACPRATLEKGLDGVRRAIGS